MWAPIERHWPNRGASSERENIFNINCLLGNFASFFFVVCHFFFQNLFFRKIILGIPLECQAVWIQIRPDVMSGLMWVQTVCKGYQQTTLTGKENIAFFWEVFFGETEAP